MNDRKPSANDESGTTERVQGVARGQPTLHIRFNNPAKHNALSVDMWEAVPPLLAQAATDDSVRMVVFSGEGDKSFVSGADISQFEDMRAAQEAVKHVRGDGRSRAAWASTTSASRPSPASAATASAAASTSRSAATSASPRPIRSSAIPAARLGLGYRYSAMKNLIDLVGPGAAKDIFFTARRIDAAEAQGIGPHQPRRRPRRTGCAARRIH